jgi:DNA-binding transcriptional MerR regulator
VAEAEGFAAFAAEPVRPNGKSATAFRTTGEVAAALDLPAHVLRFWEAKFSQLRPLKRAGGRRYYRPQDVDLLRRIRQCLYQQGYTIRGVQQLLRDGALGPDAPTPPVGCAPDRISGPPDANPDPRCLASRDALAELRKDLLEIRALLDALIRS